MTFIKLYQIFKCVSILVSQITYEKIADFFSVAREHRNIYIKSKSEDGTQITQTYIVIFNFSWILFEILWSYTYGDFYWEQYTILQTIRSFHSGSK